MWPVSIHGEEKKSSHLRLNIPHTDKERKGHVTDFKFKTWASGGMF